MFCMKPNICTNILKLYKNETCFENNFQCEIFAVGNDCVSPQYVALFLDDIFASQVFWLIGNFTVIPLVQEQTDMKKINVPGTPKNV